MLPNVRGHLDGWSEIECFSFVFQSVMFSATFRGYVQNGTLEATVSFRMRPCCLD